MEHLHFSTSNMVTRLQWLTCIMTSRTRAVVKLRRRAIENVRRIHTPPDKQCCNLLSIVAVPLFLHPLTTTERSIA